MEDIMLLFFTKDPIPTDYLGRHRYFECTFEYFVKRKYELFLWNNKIITQLRHEQELYLYELINVKNQKTQEEISIDVIYNQWRILNE